MNFENENLIENAEDMLSKLNEVQTFYGPARTQIMNSMSWMYVNNCLRASLTLSKMQAKANRKADSQSALSQIAEMQADEMAEQVKEPEKRYDHALELARYFYHTCPNGSRPDLVDIASRTLEGGTPRKAALKYVEDHLELKGDEAEAYLKKRNLKVNNPHEAALVATCRDILRAPQESDNPWMTPRDYLTFLRTFENKLSANPEETRQTGILYQLREMDSRIDWDPDGLNTDTVLIKDLQQQLVKLIENFEASTAQEEHRDGATEGEAHEGERPVMA